MLPSTEQRSWPFVSMVTPVCCIRAVGIQAERGPRIVGPVLHRRVGPLRPVGGREKLVVHEVRAAAALVVGEHPDLVATCKGGLVRHGTVGGPHDVRSEAEGFRRFGYIGAIGGAATAKGGQCKNQNQ